MKKIIIEPEDWKIIINFFSGITIKFTQSKMAAEVYEAIGRAQEADINIEKNEKK